MSYFFKTMLIVITVQLLALASRADNKKMPKLKPLLKLQNVIWGFDFINQNKTILTTRNGEIHLFTSNTKKSLSVKIPETLKQTLFLSGQGGLLDIRVSPDFDKSHFIFITYSKKKGTKAVTTLARFKLIGDEIKDFTDILITKSESEQSIHFGSRIEFKNNTEIFMTIGDRNEREQTQNLDNHKGKILRVDLNGIAMKDNPFIHHKGALPEIYSFGHRNPQGLTLRKSDGTLWSSEFGPRGGDEINFIEAGKNYGWPIVTFGKEYSGLPISQKTSQLGMTNPVTQWTPSISPSGIAFYTGQSFNDCLSCLVIATLSGQHLRLLTIAKNQVISQKEYFTDSGIRFRNVRAGLDGFLYYSTDSGEFGRIE